MSRKINITPWTLVLDGSIYYAERTYQTSIGGRKRKERFKDWNGHDLSLSGEKEWAQNWVNSRNEIDNINHF